MKKIVISGLLCLMACTSFTEEPAVRPKLKVARDGFPAGQDTPEGAACDLARAFIQHDVVLFASVCLQPYGAGPGRKDYEEFLSLKIEEIKREADKKAPSAEGPKTLGKLYTARRLSDRSTAAYGSANHGFQDVMFVDVGVGLHNEKRKLFRTLVVRNKTGKWFVHPLPKSDPQLCTGLDEEPVSKQDFRQAYEVEKPGFFN